mmetsp:Transcript_7697/g.17989  ORF Transcript_7697/g.17989 Transcript_7697/m.17989 type:complete len:93 (-) Transcript_7697:511-789(-)
MSPAPFEVMFSRSFMVRPSGSVPPMPTDRSPSTSKGVNSLVSGTSARSSSSPDSSSESRPSCRRGASSPMLISASFHDHYGFYLVGHHEGRR